MKLVTVESPEKYVCKITFSATAEELEAASQEVYERTRSTYTIKGFKKGEADRAQIEADRGEHVFWYDAINDLMDRDVPALYDAVMAENHYTAIGEPTYDLVSVKKEDGFVATATVILMPELTISQRTGFSSVCMTPATSEKEVEQTIERTRQAAAELVPHKGPAVKGNTVHMDYAGYIDDKAFPGGTAQNQTVVLGAGRMIPGFEEGIIGHKAGEEFDINVVFPERYQSQELAGKAAVFKAKLIDVCVRQLPALNSDFAKKNGSETMEAYRAAVRAQLEERKHTTALNRAKDELLNQLGSKVEGELPALLLENYFQTELQSIQQRLQAQRMSLDRYLTQMHQSRADFEANLRDRVAHSTRIQLALLTIAREQGLEVTEEELNAELEARAARAGRKLESMLRHIDVGSVRRDLNLRRAADYVVAHSEIRDNK